MSVDAIDRLGRIHEHIRNEGRARVAELAVLLDVSEMTIRRDLDTLAEQGLLRRVRGGAMAIGPQPFADRFSRHARAKDRIVAKLLDLVGPAGAIGIDASSTLQRLAAAIDPTVQLTVLTNGPDCFNALQERPELTALLTGGQLDRRTGSLVGPLAVRTAQDLSLDRLFVSAAGLDTNGTTEATLEEAEVKRALAEASAEVVAAVDHTKLGQRAPARCLALRRIDVLVTDLDPDDQRLRPWRGRVKLV